jgi:OFA family oxalate/formate antiporter-like MFS transporter
VLRNPVFWLLYVMFVLVAAGGLMMAASLAPIAKDFKIDQVPVGLFGLVLPALVFAIGLDRILDGFGRPFFGWVSDQIGRENTMVIAFTIGAGALFTLSQLGTDPVIFVLVSALYCGTFGEIYTLFPATAGDTFGAKYAASNYGMLYTAKGAASLLVPFAAIAGTSFGWKSVFLIGMTFNLIAASLALFVLKPMRVRHFANSRPVGAGAAVASPGGQMNAVASEKVIL